MTSLAPRVVLVTRRTEFDRLLATHATRGQAEFFLDKRGQSLAELEFQKERQLKAVNQAKQAVPDDWSVAQVLRDDLDRFLFTADDIVVAIGQDGLVANLAKYLTGQPVIGVTPDPDRTEGVLTPLIAEALSKLLPRVAAGDMDLRRLTMVEAKLDGEQTLAALNELFIGHRSHQSALYELSFEGKTEFQSSSGVIVSTGTGLTGWARSIMAATHRQVDFAPDERRAVYFAREPWPSRITGNKLAFGEIGQSTSVCLTSRMNEGGAIFADGIEQDFLRFDWGIKAQIGISERTLNLVKLAKEPHQWR
ncbi:diacylglycerol kinase catalytic domain-containing protein [Shumkonia mesophila]|uniref:hypothetical protein n=1 Tax=Shumkonia mesophila TaxID=2838854 RepID=UPI0029341A8F|nr:hypothetical protein [Shumkonia mesophila]